VSSTTRLLVLGCVRLFQPIHGYDVRRELMSWRAHEWANIAPGSIYSALKTLVKDGALEVLGTKAVGGRPERTTYKLTLRGEAEHAELLRETWWNVTPISDPLMAGISFLTFMPRAEALAALEHRAAQIKAQLAQLDFLIASTVTNPATAAENPDHVREMLLLLGARMAAELGWGKAFAARLARGEYTTADDPPITAADRAKTAKKKGKK
jgi:DNA-binding PadR family transcriptional regulator